MYPHPMLYKREYNYIRGSMWSAVGSAMFASFMAGVFLQRFLNFWHVGKSVSFDTLFNVVMFVLWLVAAIAHYYISKSRATSTQSPKKVDSYSIAPR